LADIQEQELVDVELFPIVVEFRHSIPQFGFIYNGDFSPDKRFPSGKKVSNIYRKEEKKKKNKKKRAHHLHFPMRSEIVPLLRHRANGEERFVVEKRKEVKHDIRGQGVERRCLLSPPFVVFGRKAESFQIVSQVKNQRRLSLHIVQKERKKKRTSKGLQQ
jgi:hypothetical protein